MTLKNLYDLADRQNIQVYSFELNAAKSLSLMDEHGHCYVAIDPMQLKNAGEEAHLLAHELGHCITGAFYNRYTPWDLRARHENRADKWAVRALVSKEAFFEALSAGCQTSWELAERLGVTPLVAQKAAGLYLQGHIV